MCVTCVPKECLILMSAMELMIAQPDVWEGGHPVKNAVHQPSRRVCPLKSFSLGIFSNVFICKCTSNSEWIYSFALESVSLYEFTKGKLNWNESFVAQTFLVFSKKPHPVVAKYITQFFFLLLFFLLLFPIDSDGQVAFWHILFHPASILGRKRWWVSWFLSSGCACFQWKW